MAIYVETYAMKVLLAATLLLFFPSTWANLLVNVHPDLNCMVHRTSNYSRKANDLILRRGEPFVVTFRVPTSEVLFDFDIEVLDRQPSDPELVKVTAVDSFDSFDFKSPLEWPVIATQPNETTTDIQCLIPPNAPVTRYSLVAKYNGQSEKLIISTIHVLFNAWNVNDTAYVASKARRDESVRSTKGKIYLNLKWEESINWDFSQFDQETLTATYELLSRHPSLTLMDRSDPALLSRAVSEVATNGTNDHGLVEVIWSSEREDYEDGKHPLDFKSSKDIFSLYLKSKSPVKYAHSWTVAALVTSMFRSLGMASRLVSGDKIGIDGNNNLLIDRCMDEKRLAFYDSHLCDSDFVLAYHSWTEVWMARKDLALTHPFYIYPSWQVVDGTAGYYDGFFKAPFGPSPVAAVRNGDVNVPFNTSSAFAMVSAPKVLWVIDSVSKEVKEITRVTLDETGLIVAYDDNDMLMGITNSYKSLKVNFQKVALHRAFVRMGADTDILKDLTIEESNKSLSPIIVAYNVSLESN